MQAVREAQLVGFLLGLSLQSDAAFADDDGPWTRPVGVQPRSLAARAGLPLPACEAAIDLLLRSGVLRAASGEPISGGESHVQIAGDVLQVQPSVAAVDWPWVLGRIAGDPPAILVARAFAELLERPDEYGTVERAALAAHACYSEGMIKQGVARAVALGVVERSARTVYRFTDLALGRRAAEPPRESPAPQSTPPAGSASEPASSPAPSAASGLVTFTANGIRLELPRDTTIELETDVGGSRSALRLRFPSR